MNIKHKETYPFHITCQSPKFSRQILENYNSELLKEESVEQFAGHFASENLLKKSSILLRERVSFQMKNYANWLTSDAKLIGLIANQDFTKKFENFLNKKTDCFQINRVSLNRENNNVILQIDPKEKWMNLEDFLEIKENSNEKSKNLRENSNEKPRNLRENSSEKSRNLRENLRENSSEKSRNLRENLRENPNENPKERSRTLKEKSRNLQEKSKENLKENPDFFGLNLENHVLKLKQTLNLRSLGLRIYLNFILSGEFSSIIVLLRSNERFDNEEAIFIQFLKEGFEFNQRLFVSIGKFSEKSKEFVYLKKCEIPIFEPKNEYSIKDLIEIKATIVDFGTDKLKLTIEIVENMKKNVFLNYSQIFIPFFEEFCLYVVGSGKKAILKKIFCEFLDRREWDEDIGYGPSWSKCRCRLF